MPSHLRVPIALGSESSPLAVIVLALCWSESRGRGGALDIFEPNPYIAAGAVFRQTSTMRYPHP
eukprot:6287861-Pyramimonas_sp.AAC.1